MASEFPAQMSSNEENVSIWWQSRKLVVSHRTSRQSPYWCQSSVRQPSDAACYIHWYITRMVTWVHVSHRTDVSHRTSCQSPYWCQSSIRQPSDAACYWMRISQRIDMKKKSYLKLHVWKTPVLSKLLWSDGNTNEVCQSGNLIWQMRQLISHREWNCFPLCYWSNGNTNIGLYCVI